MFKFEVQAGSGGGGGVYLPRAPPAWIHKPSSRAVDPDPEGKNLRKKQKTARKLVVIISKFGSAPWFFYF